MAEENVPSRVEIMESEMKQVFNVLQQLSKQIDSIQGKLAPAPASIEVLLPQSSTRGDQGRDTDDNMPELEDDTHQIVVEKAKPNSLSKTEHDKRLEKLEERLKQLQGLQDPTPTDLSIYSKVKMPEKFKMPEFEKYDGTTCPRAHLQMYLVRMTQYVNNEPLMIQLFQSSLIGPALRWYIKKNINLIETWSEASEAFLKQYKFIMDITPSREDLDRTEKKKQESFKEYAIRWRNLAAQISPEPTDFELRKMFIKTLPFEYRNRMVTTIAESFNQLIPVGEQIETGLRDGWFTEPAPVSRRLNMKKDKESLIDVNATYTANTGHLPTVQTNAGQQQTNSRPPQRYNNRRQFTPLPGSPSQVLAILRNKSLLSTEPRRPNAENFSSYDPSKKCDYHMGEVGHSTDECFVLKHRIQNLLDTKAFSFQTAKPNVQSNPLPDHADKVNMIFSSEAGQIRNVNAHMVDIYRGLVETGYYPGNEIPPFAIMEERVLRMIEAGIIVHAGHANIVSTISQVLINWEEEFAALNAEKEKNDSTLPESVFERKGAIVQASTAETAIVIEIPQPYKYKYNNAVPWSYDLDVGLVTRSGRTYAQANTQSAKPVTDEEAKEFLAVVKASEYNVVEQLRKSPVQISLLELLQTSVKHQKSLMKVLSEVHVPETIEHDKLEEFVSTILLKDQMAFSDEEIPEEGRGHTKGLYISVKCNASHVARVLIDNGSALNICPLATLCRLKIERSWIQVPKTSVRAFDGTKKETVGEIELDIQIGPTVFKILFQVMDIPTAFNFLLGRPWIHVAGAVPSSLHQSVKFVVGGKLITVRGEEDHRIYHETAIPYVEPSDKSEASYQSFELVSTIHETRGTLPLVPEISSAAIMVGKIMVGHGFLPGQGLGRRGQGIRQPIEARRRPYTVGLGYSPDRKAKKKVGLVYPRLEETFPGPAKMMHEEEEVDTPKWFNPESVKLPITQEDTTWPSLIKKEGPDDMTTMLEDIFIGAIEEEKLEETCDNFSFIQLRHQVEELRETVHHLTENFAQATRAFRSRHNEELVINEEDPTDTTWRGARLPLSLRSTRPYSPLPKSMAIIFPILLEQGIIGRELNHPTPEYFVDYDPSKQCDYHSGELGHSLDDCTILRDKVQDLLDAGVFTFRSPWLCFGNDHLLVVPSTRTMFPEHAKEAHKGEAIIDTLGQPSGKFDYYVNYSIPQSFYDHHHNIVPDGWGDVDDLKSTKPGAQGDVTGNWYEDFFVGAINEGPSGEMGAGPLE